jgi:glutaredoxin 3
MSRILLYTTPFCGYCRAAKRLLAEKTLDFEEVDVSFDRDKRAEMLDRANGQRTVPQIFIHGRHVGGYEELAALEREGKLEALLAGAPEAIAGET